MQDHSGSFVNLLPMVSSNLQKCHGTRKLSAASLALFVFFFLGFMGLQNMHSLFFNCGDSAAENYMLQQQRQRQPTMDDGAKEAGAAAPLPMIGTTRNQQSEEDADCAGRYIYMYDLPPQFNQKIAEECTGNPAWIRLCEDLSNMGLGKQFILDTNDSLSNLLLPYDAWYKSNQYSLDIVYHERLKRYPCLTDDPEKAVFSYIPFYSALDFGQNMLDTTMSARDRLSQRLVGWLQNNPHWARTGGKNHMLLIGRIAQDHGRKEFEDQWGNCLLSLTELENVTKVVVDRFWWRDDQIAMPYPTSFHPYSDDQIVSWQQTILDNARRELPVLFVGGPRNDKYFSGSLRNRLMQQCLNSSRCTLLRCDIVDCEKNPQRLTHAFLKSVFCLQPPGDSPTRKGIFDCMVSGCIPVIFDPHSISDQYTVHLPMNVSSFSVLLDGQAAHDGELDVMEELNRIPATTIATMQRTINALIPNILYKRYDSNQTTRDAFDITLEALFNRFTRASTNSSEIPRQL
ncbi:unnamed protein product [Sphagnum compactum]